MGGSAYLMDPPSFPDLEGSGFVLPRIMTVDSARRFLFQQEGPLYCFPEIEVLGFIHTK